MLKNQELWNTIRQGLPSTPSQGKDVLPVPEMLRVIEYALDDRVEDFSTAYALAKKLYESNPSMGVKNWFAGVCFDAKEYEASYRVCREILRENYSAGACFNAARAAYKAGYVEESEHLAREAFRLDPSRHYPLLDIAVAVCSQGRFDEAFEILQSIDERKMSEGDRLICEFNKGWHYLRQGNFRKGIECLHYGRTMKIWGASGGRYARPLWDGVTRPGSTVLIIGEAGIGDEIINARFASVIKQRGMNVVMSTIHGLESVLSRVQDIDRVIAGKDAAQFRDYDYWIPCMDLPYALGIDETEIPGKPYLSVHPSLSEKWSRLIPPGKRMKIGVRWMGNKLYELNLHRTIPFEKFSELAQAFPGVEWYSLQRDAGVEMLDLSSGIIPLHDSLETIEDTLAAISRLDMVITSCTSIAHLSAALGKPTWVAVPLLPYYIWAKPGKKSSWYDSVSVYRQERWKEWDAPFDEIRKDLIHYEGRMSL